MSYLFADCDNCGRELPIDELECRYCGTEQSRDDGPEQRALEWARKATKHVGTPDDYIEPPETDPLFDDDPKPDDRDVAAGDQLIYGSISKWAEWDVEDTWLCPTNGEVAECRNDRTGEIRMFPTDVVGDPGWALVKSAEQENEVIGE